MDNSRSLGNRVLSAVVATLTIVWAAGAAAFVVPQTASAAEAGDLIRGTSFSTVYFYGYDGSRYIFPNEKTYDSWFNGFSGVETISDSAVAAIPVAGNVVYRPGSRWIKITTAAETYAVARDGMIHWVETEAVATGLAGSDWNQLIDDVPDSFFDNYTEGVSLTSAKVWDGALYMDEGNYYVAWDGEKHMLSSAARSANALENRFFLDGASINDSSLDAGDDFTGFVCELSDASQTDCPASTPVGGDLMVSLASTTPSSVSVPDAANGVTVATWKFTADEATELAGLTLSYSGLAGTDDVETVYIYEGDARLDDGRSINSSTRTATFAGLNLDFAAGETRYLSAVVDMANNNEDGTFRFGIANADAVSTGGDATGSFPLWGNTHSIINASVGALNIDRNGSATSTYSVGESDAVIGRFSVQATTAGDEDVEVEAITITVDGDADASDHSDYELYQGGEKVADGVYLRDELVLFSFDEAYLVEEGDTRNFEVRATIGGEADDSTTVYIESAADVRATGVNSGFGVDVDIADFDGQSCGTTDCTTTNIEGGSITLAFNGPVAQDVRENANDHEFLRFSVTSEEYTEVQSLTFTVTGGANLFNGDDEPALTDLRLINAETGNLLSSEEMDGANADTEDEIVFTDEFVIPAGETLELAFTADIEEDVAANADTLAVSLTDWSFENADRDAITDVVPTSGVVGKTQTVVTSGLTVSLSGSPSGDKTVVRGAQDVTMARFNFSAADGGDIEVTDLTLTVQSDDDGGLGSAVTDLLAEDYIESCSLYEGDVLVAGPESPDSSNGDADGVDTIEFENFDWTITGGEDAILAAVCDLVDATPDNGAELALVIAAASDVEALDDEGDEVTVSGTANTAGTTKISVASAGSLLVTSVLDTPDESFVLAGAVDQTVSTFRFDASNEDFRVNDLTLVEIGGGEEAVEEVEITYPMNAAGTLETRAVGLVGSEATFQNIGMYVKQNTPAYVTVKVTLSDTSRNNGDAVSNSFVEFELSDAANDFEAQGVASSELATDVIALATQTTGADRHVVRETVPTIGRATTSPSGALFNGALPVFTFNVAANSTEDLVMDKFLLELGGSGDWNSCSDTDAHNLESADLTLDRVSGSSRTALTGVTWTMLDSAFGASVAGDCDDNADVNEDVKYIRATFTAEAGEVIPAGSTRTYELTINVTGAVEGDSLQVSIPAETSYASTYVSVANNADYSAITTSTTTIALNNPVTAGVVAGDILCLNLDESGTCAAGDELVLVVLSSDDTDLITTVRGYAGTTIAAGDDSMDILRRPGSFLWQDDGTQDTNDNSELTTYWGGHLVQQFPTRGHILTW